MNCFKHGFCLTTSAHCFGPRPVLQPPNGALGRTGARLRSFLLTAARRQRASRNGLLFDRMNVWMGGWVGECVGAETSLPIRDEQRHMGKGGCAGGWGVGGWVGAETSLPIRDEQRHMKQAGGSSDPHVRVQCRQGRRGGADGAVMGALHEAPHTGSSRGRPRRLCWRAGGARQRVVEERYAAAGSVGGYAIRRSGALAPRSHRAGVSAVA